MKKKPLQVIVIVGPTASGKTALSLDIAEKFDGEIISADSRQVYRGLDIGTGKVTKEEMHGIPHHLLDIRNPNESYSVADFKSDAEKTIAEIASRGKLPIIVGGTFQYVETLTGGDVIPRVPPNPELRAELDARDTDSLFEELKKRDPERAATIDGKNTRRLVRALEIVESAGKVPRRARHTPSYNALIIGITLSKDELRERIEKRLDERIEGGMLREAEHLHIQGLPLERMEDLGLEYRYLARFLKGEMTKEEMRGKLGVEIWRYAKRQLVWLKKMEDVRWYEIGETGKVFEKVRDFLVHSKK